MSNENEFSEQMDDFWKELDKKIDQQWSHITSWEQDESTTKLVNYLQSQLETGNCNKKKLVLMISNAKDFHYHDFKSKLHMPIVSLINHATIVGLPKSFINDVKNGVYDA